MTKRVMSIYERCWCRERTTFWAPLAKIVICDAGDEARRARREKRQETGGGCGGTKVGRLLHRLWVSGEVYEPLRNSQKAMNAAA